AWTYHTGDAAKGTTIECTPIVIERVMFLTTAGSKVVALDAANGCELWKYDPYAGVHISQPKASGGVNRGVAYWRDRKHARIRRAHRRATLALSYYAATRRVWP